MIRLSNVKIPLQNSKDLNYDFLKQKVCSILKAKVEDIKSIKISKKSLDTREKLGGFYVISLDLEVKNENKYLKIKDVSKVDKFVYNINSKKLKKRPVVIGFGPAGMMCALFLAKNGANPIIIERGKKVEERQEDINKFWKNGTLNLNSNVQFGEGGAGTFSDGKLTTGIKDFRCRILLEEFVKASAPEEILYLSKPHIGTDRLRVMVKNIRNQIINLGGEILFKHKLIKINTSKDKVCSVIIEKENKEIIEIDTDNVVLAIGHSARDTFEMILNTKQPITQKPFAVGLRIEHKQELINSNQYGKFACFLDSASYKLAVHLKNGRSVYTFCMCPGGYVVGAASEENRLVTNGMSYYSRAGKNANSAILVGVTPNDFKSSHPLAGVEFQRKLEEKAFIEGGSNYFAPVQMLCDFLEGKPTKEIKGITPTYKPNVKPADFKNIFPEYLYTSLQLGIKEMDNKIKGFASGDAILTAVESRSSSPIRILRDESMQSLKFKGLYPCGEGCGYAGGIVSAGVDGIKCAEAIFNNS